MLQAREMRFHCANGLVVRRKLPTIRGSIGCKKMRFAGSYFFTHVSLHTVLTAGGQTCSIDDSFAEIQKHQRAAKPVCSVNTNMIKNASFTLIDVQ